jgi:hypothetical protein
MRASMAFMKASIPPKTNAHPTVMNTNFAGDSEAIGATPFQIPDAMPMHNSASAFQPSSIISNLLYGQRKITRFHVISSSGKSSK